MAPANDLPSVSFRKEAEQLPHALFGKKTWTCHEAGRGRGELVWQKCGPDPEHGIAVRFAYWKSEQLG